MTLGEKFLYKHDGTRVSQMTPEQADKWCEELKTWIKKWHPHLNKRWWEKEEGHHVQQT